MTVCLLRILCSTSALTWFHTRLSLDDGIESEPSGFVDSDEYCNRMLSGDMMHDFAWSGNRSRRVDFPDPGMPRVIMNTCLPLFVKFPERITQLCRNCQWDVSRISVSCCWMTQSCTVHPIMVCLLR